MSNVLRPLRLVSFSSRTTYFGAASGRSGRVPQFQVAHARWLSRRTAVRANVKQRGYSKHFRRLAYVVVGLGAVYLADKYFYASCLARCFRTFATGVVVAADYKINFKPYPPMGGTIADLHERNAARLFDVLHKNGGLYLKIGQAVAMQSAILPPEFQRRFAKMFDDAPQNEWEDVAKVIQEDFGKTPEEVFGVSFDGEPGKGVMEKTARASASVAQVHWARLADGREVAIKIQKREIRQQVDWDLWAFKCVYLLTGQPFTSNLLTLCTE